MSKNQNLNHIWKESKLNICRKYWIKFTFKMLNIMKIWPQSTPLDWNKWSFKSTLIIRKKLLKFVKTRIKNNCHISSKSQKFWECTLKFCIKQSIWFLKKKSNRVLLLLRKKKKDFALKNNKDKWTQNQRKNREMLKIWVKRKKVQQ